MEEQTKHTVMENKKSERVNIDIASIFRTLWSNKRRFLKVWVITFVLSCIWILPQPRYYTTEVSIAPESEDAGAAGGLASLASNFGFDIGSGSSDAIYPQLYPDLISSTEFITDLFDVHVTTLKGDVSTDYYDYLVSHQKKNLLTLPFSTALRWLKSLGEKQEDPIVGKDGKRFDPFHLTHNTTEVVKAVQSNISCVYSRTTSVVTITVTDQDPMVSALMADSIKAHLQNYITDYRTKKARLDVEHYQQMRDSAEVEYDKAMRAYSRFCDAHQNVILQSFQSERDKLENDLSTKQTMLASMEAQLQASKVKLQERTPAFTTLINATIPVKPAGPKRMIFVAAMLFLATLGTIVHVFRRELMEWF